MTVSNEQLIAEETIVRVLRATKANDVAVAPARHSRQTPQCPNIARFAAVLRRKSDRSQTDDWTAEEARHVRGCAFCQSLFPLFAAAAATAQAATASEDTMTNLDTSQETQTGLPPEAGTKKSGKSQKPRAGE